MLENANNNLCVKRQEFNYGIETLRILSMLMVVTLHVLLQGGILNNVVYLSTQYHITWLLEIACYCAVNCYAMISGYVMINSEFKYTKYIPLWLQVMIYSIGITLVFMILTPGSVTKDILFKSFFPVLGKRWWYFTAYTGLYFLIPFLNFLVKQLSKERLKALCVTLVILFSILPTLITQLWGDLFGGQGGYSLLWLVVMYILGASFRRFEEDLRGRIQNLLKRALVTWIFCILVTFLMHNFGAYLPEGFPGKQIIVNSLVNYVSPTILGCAFCMLVIFSGFKISNERWKENIKRISKLSFGVYLIHVHPLVWQYVLGNRFIGLSAMPWWKMTICIVIVVVAIFTGCIVIDAIREKVFAILHIKEKFVGVKLKFK